MVFDASQLAALDLNNPGVLNQRYVPPHMRSAGGGSADFTQVTVFSGKKSICFKLS